MAGDRRVLLVNSIYHLTNDGAVTVMAGQITVLRTVFPIDALEIGLLTGTAFLVTAVVQILVGALSDRREPSRFLGVGILLLALGSFSVAASTSLPMFLAFVAVSRIGASFYHPVGIAWIGREFRGQALDRSMGVQSAFGDSGVILGMATSAVLGLTLGWQSPFLLWGALNLAAVALAFFLVPRQPPLPTQTRPRADYASIVRDVRLWLFPLGLGGAAFAVFTSFGPPLLKDKFGFTDAAAGVSIALWILAGALVAFFFGRVSRRFGRFRILAVSYALLGIASFVGATSGEPIFVLATFWTLGSALFVTYPAIFSFVSEAGHRQLQGATFGFIFLFQLLGGALASYAAGSLASALGPTPAIRASIPFLLVGGLALGGFVYLVAIRGRVPNSRDGVLVAPTT